MIRTAGKKKWFVSLLCQSRGSLPANFLYLEAPSVLLTLWAVSQTEILESFGS